MFRKLILIGLVLAFSIVLPAAAIFSDEKVPSEPMSIDTPAASGGITIDSGITPPAGAAVFDLIVGGGNPKSAIDVGDVYITKDCTAGKLTIRYVIVDSTPTPFDNWYLTQTHVAVATNLYNIPQSQGNPVPGQFPKEYSATFDIATKTTTYTQTVDIRRFPCGQKLYIAAHAVVQDPCGLKGLELALPTTVLVTVTRPGNGGEFPSYSDAKIVDSTGVLTNNALDTWCVDTDRHITPGTAYTMNVYSSYEALPAGTVDKPQNFDRVNWVINYIVIGQHLKAADGTDLGVITAGDVQRAIWTLIDNNPNYDTGYAYSPARVNRIVELASAKGAGFKPVCGQKIAIVFTAQNVQTIIAQVIMGGVNIPCDSCRSGTGWAALKGTQTIWQYKNWITIPKYDFPFSGKNWATYVTTPGCKCPTSCVR